MSPLAAVASPSAHAAQRAAHAHCERAVLLMAACRGNPHEEINRALDLVPDLVLAHCLRVGLAVVADDDAPAGALADSLAAAAPFAGHANPRERAAADTSETHQKRIKHTHTQLLSLNEALFSAFGKG